MKKIKLFCFLLLAFCWCCVMDYVVVRSYVRRRWARAYRRTSTTSFIFLGLRNSLDLCDIWRGDCCWRQRAAFEITTTTAAAAAAAQHARTRREEVKKRNETLCYSRARTASRHILHHWPMTRQLINHLHSPGLLLLLLLLRARRRRRRRSSYYYDDENPNFINQHKFSCVFFCCCCCCCDFK